MHKGSGEFSGDCSLRELAPHPDDREFVLGMLAEAGHSAVDLDLEGRIVGLALNYSMLSVEQLSRIDSLSQLRSLWIFRCPRIASDKWLESLAKCKNLRKLALYANYARVSDSSIPLLEKLTQLEDLELDLCMSAQGLGRLRQLLPGCRIKGSAR